MFGFFKKKKVEDPYITTNPPAREITLANRKRVRDQKVNYFYKIMLTNINNQIRSGILNSVYYIPNNQYLKIYCGDDAYAYIAARQLRRDGFKVSMGKRKETKSNGSVDMFGAYVYSSISYNKHIKISW